MNTGWHKNFIHAKCKIILLVNFIFSLTGIYAQQTKIDSLKNLITNTKKDTSKIILYENLGQEYRNKRKKDSAVFYYKEALKTNEKNNYSLQRQCLDIAVIQYILYEMGNYLESLQYASRQLALTEQIKDTFQMGFANATFAHNYKALGEYRQALNHYFKARRIFMIFFHFKNEIENDPYINQCIGEVYLKMNKLDSALIFTRQSLVEKGTDPANKLYSTRMLGDIYLAKGDDQRALNYYRKYIPDFIKYNIPDFIKYKQNSRDLGFVFNSLAKIFQKRGQIDSAIFYARKAFSNAQEYQDQENLYNAAIHLSDYYKNKNDHEAFSYLKIATQAKDSMISSDKLKQAQLLSFNEQVREKEQQQADDKEAARIKIIIIISALIVSIFTFLIWNRIRQLRVKHTMILEQKEAEKLKAKYEKELLELEAKALRAQMNPHFIFNCMNSIKSLIQQKHEDKAVNYLTTFSKLLRTVLQNSDKREITLYDEMETCRLYAQLESLRFGNKFSYHFNVDETIDLKSLLVPALIIQPFIENAIWHGIMPKEESGTLTVAITRREDAISCIIDDDGIGREMSKQNKFKGEPSIHQSKGVHLTQSRLDLDNALNQRNASLEIIDKRDAEGKSCGTVVVLTFKEY